MSAVKLYTKYSQEDLVRLMEDIQSRPENHMPAGSVYLYTPNARKKLENITRAITWHLADKRAAAGRPVLADGYSGRNCNRR